MVLQDLRINAIFRICSCYEDQSKHAGYFCGCNEIHYREMYFEVAASHRREHSTCNEAFPGEKKKGIYIVNVVFSFLGIPSPQQVRDV